MDKVAANYLRTPFIVIAVALLLAGPMKSVAGADEHAVPFTTMASGTASGIHTLALLVIRRPAAWSRIWHKHAVGLREKEAAEPTIDFTQEMVVAVFAGEVSVDARVTIIKIVHEKQRLRVVYRIGTPQPGPMPLDLATATPFHIVRAQAIPIPRRLRAKRKGYLLAISPTVQGSLENSRGRDQMIPLPCDRYCPTARRS